MEEIILEKKLMLGAFFCCCSIGAVTTGYAATGDALKEGKYNLFNDRSKLYEAPENPMAPPVVVQTITEIPKTVIEPALEQPIDPENEPVDLLADRVEYDENNGIVSAIGDVELVQAGRILRAEKITYNLNKDDVQAMGNVVLNELTGDTYFAESVQLQDKMKDGFVRGLTGVLADGSRFTAEEAEKIADLKIVMSKASYTACEPCKADPSKAPPWKIKARKVTHHKDEFRVSYDDATFEVAGVPVVYTPYFSHPDGSVKRKSGFLVPSIGFDSQMGTSYAQKYYWDIAPERDATFGVEAFTDELPFLTAEYRHRFKNAEIVLDGGVSYSSRTVRRSDEDVTIDEEERGHLFAEGLWDINDKWRAGTELELVSDDQYARQYDITNKDILENKLYVERFSDRDYATVRAINFKDIRISERREDQPNVLPEIYAKFIGQPNGVLGGRWDIETSALGLQRDDTGQDVNRASVKGGWNRRHVSNIGLVNTLDLTARGDVYKVDNRDISNDVNTRSKGSSAVRGFTQAHLQSSYPISKRLEKSEIVIEPIGAITLGSNLNKDSDIPNEDSQDVSLRMTNLFSPNRFPGYDLIEDESFGAYGVRTALYGDNGYKGEVFFGQSYRFDEEDENLFPTGSGLSDQQSDFVGDIKISAGPNLSLNYSTQLENSNLSSQRHEVDATGAVGRLTLNTRYFYANALQGTDLNSSREQIGANGRFKLTDKWSLVGGARYDLAQESQGLRYARYGLDYQGQCVNFLISGQRSLTRDSSGDSSTEFILRLGLKNLGEFETSGVSIGGSEE